ncbi:hypothetical protein [uncultured Sulfitobacter sp.]|uniref:hypothetical protein n=1 Tax=uncultured Sulfitobacter sp. TaxID=191468 RepID=UPI00262259CA|nr:hypothetical protein [uncultured Sulfitobacter sp.]
MNTLALLEALEQFIASHQLTLVVIAIPMLTLLVTALTNRSSERKSLAERRIERDLERERILVEFRQAWINDLRDALVEYCSQVFSSEERDDQWMNLIGATTRIRLLMNPNDPDFAELDGYLSQGIAAFSKDEGISNLSTDINDVSQRILKREWDRLKEDLISLEDKFL